MQEAASLLAILSSANTTPEFLSHLICTPSSTTGTTGGGPGLSRPAARRMLASANPPCVDGVYAGVAEWLAKALDRQVSNWLASPRP
jgi:hypothetical protein